MTINNNPLVSVVIPVYNGELYLNDALTSLQAQTYRRFQAIVVDDGSTDRTAEIAKSFREAQYLFQENAGPGPARNRGIRIAKGDFFTFLDSDDIWPEHRLRTQIEFMSEQPDVAFAVGRCKTFIQRGFSKPAWVDEAALQGQQIGYFPGTLMATRNAFNTVGFFNPHFRVGEGAEWFVRAKESGLPMAVIDEVLLHRRVHQSNLTHQGDQINSNILLALKESMDRKRKRKIDSEAE